MQGNGKVFISHAHADNERCAPLLAALAAWGVDYWFDVASMEAGADLSTRIQQAIQERDVFIRVCTAAAQQSYWVRMETGAFRGLQAEAHREGQDGRRVLINLILDPAYQREPFDLAAIFIDATHQPLSAWLDELRRALRLNAQTAGPAMDAPAEQGSIANQAPAAPPSASAGPASDLSGLPDAAVPPAPSPAAGGETTAHAARPATHSAPAASPTGPNIPGRGALPPARRDARTRILMPAAVGFAVMVAFVAVTSLLTNRPTGAAGAQIHASPTPTWTLPPTLTPTATLALTPPAPTAPPLPYQPFNASDAFISFQVPLSWGTPNDEGYCSSCNAVVLDLPGPPSRGGTVYGLIELLKDQYANLSDDEVVSDAQQWLLLPSGVSEVSGSRQTVTVGGVSCRRAAFTSNDGAYEAWVLGCQHAGREYAIALRTSPGNWTADSSGDFASILGSIQWQ